MNWLSKNTTRLAVLTMLALLLPISKASANPSWGEVLEISVGPSAQKFDIFVHVRWTGQGDREGGRAEWVQIRHGSFGHEGVDRILALATSAMLASKNLWFRFNDSDPTVLLAVGLQR